MTIDSTVRSTFQAPLRIFALSALALALPACKNFREPTPQPQATVIPQVYTALPQKNNAPSIAAQGYREFFADTRLKQVIERALINNRDMRAAALNIDRVQQQYQITSNGQLPTVGATAGYARGTSAASGTNANNSYNVGLGVTAYELDLWGRIANLKDAALENYFATQSTRDAVQVALVGQVAQAWTAISFAEQNLQLAQQTLKIQQDAYNLNKKRFDVGIDSEVPLRQAQISVETAKSDLAAYKTQISQAKNALNLLVGEQVSNHLLPNRSVKITNARVLSAGLPSELLNNRPDLRSAEYQLRAAGANIGAARARLYPTISLTGNAGYASNQLGKLFNGASFGWSIGPKLDVPIFDWGTRESTISISETDQKIALNNYEKSIQTAFREVNDVLATRANIDDRIEAQRRLVEATNKTYQLSQARFRAGIDSYLTVLDAQRNNYNAQKGLLALQQISLNSQIELYKTLGGGLEVRAEQAPPSTQ